ncbi:MAG: tail fiber domain-containing protein [Polyangiaceae bacterium]|nr:tail fiber domain-containing protein [Polyangiaceae bacterium]
MFDPTLYGTNSDGTTQDPLYDRFAFGGYIGTPQYDKDGNLIGYSGSDQDVNRYRSLAGAASQQQAYQADFSGANEVAAQALQDRATQQQALALLQQSANGQAPSQAAILGGGVAGQSLASQLTAQAAAKGGSLAQAAANAQSLQAMQQQQLSGAMQYGNARTGELSTARNAYGQGAGAMGTQDLTAQQLYQQQATAQAQSEMTQRQLNAQKQLGYEQMGYNAQNADLQSQLQQRGVEQQVGAIDEKNKQSGWDRALGYGKALISTIGAFAALGSDERMKQGIRNVDMGRALEEGLEPYEYSYLPGFAESQGQVVGEQNVGPMAQRMARNDITGSAVMRGPDGLLRIDQPKALKLSLAAAGHLAAQQREQNERLKRLEARR